MTDHRGVLLAGALLVATAVAATYGAATANSQMLHACETAIAWSASGPIGASGVGFTAIEVGSLTIK